MPNLVDLGHMVQAYEGRSAGKTGVLASSLSVSFKVIRTNTSYLCMTYY